MGHRGAIAESCPPSPNDHLGRALLRESGEIEGRGRSAASERRGRSKRNGVRVEVLNLDKGSVLLTRDAFTDSSAGTGAQGF